MSKRCRPFIIKVPWKVGAKGKVVTAVLAELVDIYRTLVSNPTPSLDPNLNLNLNLN
jgi:hypothetical protein